MALGGWVSLDSQDITPKMFQSWNFKRIPHDKCIQVHVSENSESSFLDSKLLTFRIRRLCQATLAFINLWRECPVAPQSRSMLLKSIMALFTSCGCQQLHPEFPPYCYCNPDHQFKKNTLKRLAQPGRTPPQFPGSKVLPFSFKKKRTIKRVLLIWWLEILSFLSTLGSLDRLHICVYIYIWIYRVTQSPGVKKPLISLPSQTHWDISPMMFHWASMHGTNQQKFREPTSTTVMVNGWFGSRWFEILGLLRIPIPFIFGDPIGIQTTGPQTNN